MTRHPFLSLKQSNSSVEKAMGEAALRVIASGRYLHGPETEAFERELSESCGGAGIAIGCSNGLDAIRLILRAYIETGRLSEGDEVLIPANTYIASILPVSEFGLIPVPVEPDPRTMNLDFNEARCSLTDRTRAVMLVHLYGTPCWDSAFAAEARKRGILLIEDNAQAIGALAAEPGFNGTRSTGMLADAAAFSFYPTKNIGALGDAGAVMTADSELAAAVRALANYGSDTRYHNIYRGYNCRIDELQAAMLRVQLSRLDDITRRRGETAALYSSLIDNPDVKLPEIIEGTRQVWHQYVVRTPHRDAFRCHLQDRGIATDVHYAVPPHLQPCYKDRLGGPWPVTEALADTVVSLPIADITDESVHEIAEAVNSFRS